MSGEQPVMWTPADVDERLREADDRLTYAEDIADHLDEIRDEKRRASAMKTAELADGVEKKCKRISARLREVALPPV